MSRFDSISFLTDYGLDDEFVGVCKAVIRELAPQVTVIDLTHGIRPFDVRGGSLALARSISYVPNGVVLAVVDPGVATSRKAVAIEVADGAGVVIGPDNGLLAPAVAMTGGAQRAVELTASEYRLPAPGATFDGRDVFAPAAAHVCNGVDIGELGPDIDPALLVPGTIPLPRLEAGELICETLWVDRFGNVQLNIGPEDVPGDWDDVLEIAITTDPTSTTARAAHRSDNFAGLVAGAVGLVLDSTGMLAICLDQRSAADELMLGAGDQVVVRPLDAAGEAAPTTPVELGRRSPG